MLGGWLGLSLRSPSGVAEWLDFNRTSAGASKTQPQPPCRTKKSQPLRVMSAEVAVTLRACALSGRKWAPAHRWPVLSACYGSIGLPAAVASRYPANSGVTLVTDRRYARGSNQKMRLVRPSQKHA
jgi:hypothetical protein